MEQRSAEATRNRDLHNREVPRDKTRVFGGCRSALLPGALRVRRGDRASAGDLMKHNMEPLEWRSEEGSLRLRRGPVGGRQEETGPAAEAAERSATLRIPFIFARKGGTPQVTPSDTAGSAAALP